jgi:hypothetical protein
MTFRSDIGHSGAGNDGCRPNGLAQQEETWLLSGRYSAQMTSVWGYSVQVTSIWEILSTNDFHLGDTQCKWLLSGSYLVQMTSIWEILSANNFYLWDTQCKWLLSEVLSANDFYLGDTQCKWLLSGRYSVQMSARTQAIMSETFMVVLSPSRQIPGLGHSRLVPNAFQFITSQSSYIQHYIV